MRRQAKMHTAYNCHQLLKLPLNIESMASAGEHLLVGTKEGHLLMYEVKLKTGQPSVQMLRSNKYFSKKPILQLGIVPEYSILVALKENMVSVHDIDMAVKNFPLISQVPRSKGTNLFCLDVLRTPNESGGTSVVVRLAVVLRRKLQLYYWKNRKFHDLQEDVSLQDIPRSLAWTGQAICLGARGEYSLVRLDDTEQKSKELFPTGKNQEPRVTLMSDNRFALDKDEQTTFISSDGVLNPKAVQWSEVPVNMVHDSPYLVSVLSKSVEIRCTEPRILIQTIEMPKPKLTSCAGKGRVYVASQQHVYCLCMVPVGEQVPQLLKDKQFELAVTLANICGTEEQGGEEASTTIKNIETLMAFDLFCSHKFPEAMSVFLRLSICCSHVIGLYSGLLPPAFADSLRYPDSRPVLQGRQQENALLSLIEYLTQVRHNLQKSSSPSSLASSPMVEGVDVIRSRVQALQIIDTTLLKCYLATNDALVASLLRLKDNHCHLEEAERVLKKGGKLTELVILYNTRGLHRKALELLRKHAGQEDSVLRGHSRTVQYLQNLGSQHIKLILEFSLWVLLESPEEGLPIFTEDMDTVESLPREQVLDWLLKKCRGLVVPYLEHLILVWQEQGSLFHNSIILQYKDQILESNHSDTVTRNKLRTFLSTEPVCYTPEQVLTQFPYDCLHEERAVLLGRSGRHREALSIYVHVLGSLTLAKEYCASQPSCVYQDLVDCLLSGPSPDLASAIDILETQGGQVSLSHVLETLPTNTDISRIETFLTSSLQATVRERHRVQMSRALSHSQHLQLQEQRITTESVRLDISEATVCAYCRKRFTTLSAFARLPDGLLLHYSCYVQSNS